MSHKKIVQRAMRQGALILSKCALFFATLVANSACCGPYYEPEQPKELERLKKNHK